MSKETTIAAWILIPPFVIAVYALCVYVFQMLWNIVISGIFHGPALNFWQALAVFIFLSVIGGFFKNQSSK